MREIYLLNPGDCLDKVKYEYRNNNLTISKDKINNCRYVTLDDGEDDIFIVKNYLPLFLHKVKHDETLMDILANGYQVDGVKELHENDLIILNKPRSIKYVVKPLQKIDDIAKEFGITNKYIIETNNLATEQLFVGQILWL